MPSCTSPTVRCSLARLSASRTLASNSTGVKAGPIFQAAANWGGIGAIFLGLDNIFVALKCSKEMIQRTVSLNAIGCFIRLGVSITAGSQKWGGVHVHKEYLQGIAITVSISPSVWTAFATATEKPSTPSWDATPSLMGPSSSPPPS